MTETLEQLLQAAADPVTASALAPRRALEGGRRRRRRRRAALLAATLGAAVVAAGLTVPGLRDRAGPDPANPTDTQPPDPADPYLRLLDGPGHGDLLADGRYTKAALATWAAYSAGTRVGRPVGEARVVWAGRSPAGPAAVLVQRTELRAEDLGSGGRPARSSVIGFVGVDSDGRPRVVGWSVWPHAPRAVDVAAGLAGTTGMRAWFVDPEMTVLATLDVGAPVGFGIRWTYGPDGTRSMPLTPLTMHDGAAFVRLPLRGAGYPVRVSRLPGDGPGQEIAVAGQPNLAVPAGTGWTGADGRPAALGLGPRPEGGAALRERFATALGARTKPPGTPWALTTWTAAGRLPDGTGVVLGESGMLPDPARAYVAVFPGSGAPLVVDGGVVPQAGTVPRIDVALPGGRGRAVADSGTRLRWRTGGGAWSAPVPDAALVPAAATELAVARPGAPEVVVPLSPVGGR